jgi:uncharacterized protein DUF481
MSGPIGTSSARRAWRCAVLGLLCVTWPAWAGAAPKTDTVLLRNGDRLTCEIKRLQQARLTVSTDPLDTVSVHWGEVLGVNSPRVFEVTLASGDRYYGGLGMSSVAGEVVLSLGGGPFTTVKLADITALVPIGSSFWSRIDGNMDVGFSFAQANLETHWTFNAGATYRSSAYLLSSSVASQLTAREDADRTSRTTVSLTGNRLLADQWLIALIGQLQQNEELQLDLRTVSGGGVGKILSQTNHRTISLYSGLVYTREQFVDEPVANAAEIAVGGQLDFYTPHNDDFSLTNTLVSYYSLSTPGRVRIELQSAWRHEFLKDFYWSLNGVESFDSHPPDTQKQNDFSLSLSIGWKF